ncbi:MAG: SCP2 domain-containing protein [Gammaproteobacteria bacterium]
MLEALINTYLRLDPDNFERLKELSGKIIAIESQGHTIYFAPGAEGIKILSAIGTVPDTTIRGTLIALLKQENLSIEGDTEIAQRLRDILNTMDIDWEEQLSHIIGDIPAHQVGNFARQGNKALKSLRQTSTEYLQEEARCVPPPEEVQDFMQDVDDIRDAVERLEARINVLAGENK